MSYSPPDFFELESLLCEQERQIQLRVRQFVEKKCLPRIGELYQEGRFPTDLISEIAGLGILGCNLKGYGCAGLSELEYGLIMMELERGDSGLRSFASVQSSLAMYAIYKFGSEQQKQEYLPKMATGEVIGCFGLTEPDFGSNPKDMLSTAKATKSGFVLNGTKRWITNGGISKVMILWAKMEGRIQGFLVPLASAGCLVKPMTGKLSLRASVTSEVILDDCEVSSEALLPEAKGLASALECLNSARFGIAWGVLGAAMACYDEALRYSKERIVFGSPAAQKQLVQAKLTWMLSEITKGQLLARRLAELKQNGRVRPAQISLGKMNNVRIALECARLSRDILGANGVSDEYQSMRHLCNLESVLTYEGTEDIHRLIVGQDITGLAAY